VSAAGPIWAEEVLLFKLGVIVRADVLGVGDSGSDVAAFVFATSNTLFVFFQKCNYS
jgi:hypothetical protein